MILVTGATGNVGRELVDQLSSSGVPVRALTRQPGRASLPAAVETVTGDLDQPQTLVAGLTGVRAVFLLPGYRDMPGVLAEARTAGVERVVLLSGSSVPGGEMSNAITRYMADSEEAVRGSGLSWTMLRANGFMSNALQWAAQVRAGDVVRLPFAGVPRALIDPYDIAAVAARALVKDEHVGRAYRLSGPQPVLPAEQVRTLATVLGRELRFEAQPDAEARAQMNATVPAEYVDAFFRFFVDGTLDESAVYPTVEEITGSPPRTFLQWATAHAGEFR